MRRREFLVAFGGAAAWSMIAHAQRQNIPRLCFLTFDPGTLRTRSSRFDAFFQRLHDLGYQDGRTIDIRYLSAENDDDRFPTLIDECLSLKPAVIAASPTPAALTAKAASDVIPVVGISFDNPVEHGLIQSLARPGGNVTGLAYSVGPEIFAKDLELLRELVTEVRKVAVLSGPTRNVNHGLMLENVAGAARAMGLAVSYVEATTLPDDLDALFDAMAKDRVEALFVFGDPAFGAHAARLADLAAQYRLPAIYTNRPFVEAGGLMSYAPDFREIWRRGAAYVDKILKGASPADLPSSSQPN